MESMTMYELMKEETLHAAEAYAETCERVGAEWDRMTIIRFCVNSFPAIKGQDLLDIADSIRGRYIQWPERRNSVYVNQH